MLFPKLISHYIVTVVILIEIIIKYMVKLMICFTSFRKKNQTVNSFSLKFSMNQFQSDVEHFETFARLVPELDSPLLSKPPS